MNAKAVTIQLIHADITTLEVDAIVNAANQSLLGGGGIDGAIHHAAGPELLDACERIPEVGPDIRCPFGEARITPAFRLPAKHIIHTVGPRWEGGENEEPVLLGSAYWQSMQLAHANGIRSIAFPSISTGLYQFPFDRACQIAFAAVERTLLELTFEQVVMVYFTPEELDRAQELFADASAREDPWN